MAKDELLKTNKIRILQKTKRTTCTVILYALLVFGVFIVCFPFLWMVLTSIKTSEEVLYLTFFPRAPQWHNYATVFDRVDILRALLNTLIVEITVVPCGLFFSLLASYSFAKLRLKHRFIKQMTLLTVMMVPYATIMLPQYQMFRMAGLIGTLLPLILPGLLGNIGAMFFFTQYMYSIPDSYLEAARIDGSSSFGILMRIVFPLMVPAVIAQVIFGFVGNWNDFFAPSIYLSNPDNMTLQVALSFLNTTDGVSDKPLVMAGAVVVSLPLFAIYLSFQRFFIGSLSVSGIKG